MSYLIDRLQNELVNLIFDNRNNIKLLNKFKTKEQINQYVDRLSIDEQIKVEQEIKQILLQKSR